MLICLFFPPSQCLLIFELAIIMHVSKGEKGRFDGSVGFQQRNASPVWSRGATMCLGVICDLTSWNPVLNLKDE